MRISYLLLLLLPGFAATAQTPFQKLYYDQDTLYWSTNVVIEAANGDVVEVCRLLELAPDTNCLVFRRLDADGALLFSTRIIPPTGAVLEMHQGLELPDGSFLLFGGDFPRCAVVHLDAQGNLLSAQHRTDNYGFYRSAFWENDSTIIALSGDVEQGNHWLLVSRFSSTGAYLGAQGYIMEDHGAEGVIGIPCAAGGVLIAAYGNDTLGDGSSSGIARTCLLRLDDAGNVLWAKRYGRPGYIFYPTGLVEKADGSVLVGGGTWNVDGPTQCYLMQVDAQGEPLFARVLQDALEPANSFPPRGFMANTDTTVLFTGFMMAGAYMLACDHAGTPLMAAELSVINTVDKPVRSASGDLLIPVAGITPNGPLGGVALGVWRTADPFTSDCTNPMSITSTTPELWIGQVYEQQPMTAVFEDITAQCTQTASVMTAFDPCLGTEVAPPPALTDVRVWPVPAAGQLTVRAPNMQRVDILDGAGRFVLTAPAQGASTLEVDIARLSAGPYLVRIATEASVHILPMVKE